jgi:hypothetical protein
MNHLARTAPGAEDSGRLMEICSASSTLKDLYYHEMSQKMEVVSNLHPLKILGEGSKNRLSTLTFVRTFSQFTTRAEPRLPYHSRGQAENASFFSGTLLRL